MAMSESLQTAQPLHQTTRDTSALVIGTGISGLFTAIKLAAAGVSTLLLTKTALDESNSRYAQGGIAAVLPSNTSDSLELHLQDTLRAGAGLCDPVATQSILAEGYAAILDLLEYGVPFDRNHDNGIALTREAAHSVERILHAGGDATGHSVEMALIAKVRANPLISVMEYTQVTELLTVDNRVIGCRAVDYKNTEELVIYSPNTVLATGGIGRLYSHTTNPAIATGDGIALAHEAGAKVSNLEFIQFHPTAFYAVGKLHFLVSEALRGEGAILQNDKSETFAKRYHPDGELAPRDIVTRGIFAEMQQSGQQHVYLDITHLPAETIEKRFPTILANCLRFGVDIRKDLIPVAPAAHYLMGGIAVDHDGQTSVQGLYAVGESAQTGLHGANRLASNSLLECVVLARRVSSAVMAHEAHHTTTTESPSHRTVPEKIYSFQADLDMETLVTTLHQLMWENVGILRSESKLRAALDWIAQTTTLLTRNGWKQVIPMGQEFANQLLVASLVARAALNRTQSIGAHMRLDAPTPMPENTTIAELTDSTLLPGSHPAPMTIPA